ncbi:hypothetical protein DFH07DRAFT_745298 [Mycena maculata]|uniref:Protein-S-isoprenylcysteine O-methyltransferase n=1 Tax=Mycena maculata TaxID=230809 RepID=A0AAD7IY74_9AGAR|nr:hypothetical protein DFH07DRAFT_745298 [Mycena maculata]
MSLLRLALIGIEAVCNQMAFTPPNPSVAPKLTRFHTEEPYFLQMAPFISRVTASLETLYYLFTLGYFRATRSPVCLASQPNIHITPLFCIGWMAVILGTYIRLACFRTLKEFFTFDLTIHANHKLITDGFYGHVRHPAYTGSLLMTAGLSFTHLTRGNWATECGPLMVPFLGPMIGTFWFLWTLAVGLSRVNAEDAQMRKMFPQEFEAWAAKVPWCFLPGLI